MDFFGGWRPSPAMNENLSLEENEMAIAERIAAKESDRQERTTKIRALNLKSNQQFRTGAELAEQRTARFVGGAAEAAGIGIRQGQEDFSSEQRMLSGMFMGGNGTFWNLPDTTTNVRIHNDLNPSKRGDYGTANCFGFGRNGERSGLF